MSKEESVPRLRFPGFEGEWERKRLGDLLEFKNGINAAKEQYGRGVKFINVLDILSNDYITYEKIIGSVDVDQSTVDKYAVDYGDILFQRSSETREEVGTASVYLDSNARATFGGFVIRGKKIGDYDPVFLNKLLKTDKARDSITSRSGGSTRYNVGQEILSSVELAFPSLAEQTKIADFLSAVDERLQILKRKKELLETYKKGMMQRLFSQELRFKDADGKDFPDWEERRLGDYLEVSRQKNFDLRFSKSHVLSVSGEVGIVNQIEFQGRSFAGESVHNYGVVEHGDVVYTKSPLKSNPYGIVKVNKGKAGIVSTLYAVYKCREEIDGVFLEYYFELDENLNSYLRPLVQKGSKNDMKINNEKVLTGEVTFPSLAEQTKIADFLSSLDAKIQVQQGLISRMETWKKGLLQAMFVG